MRIHFYLSLLLILATLVTSCVKDEPETATLTLSATDMQFEKNGGEHSLTITTNQEKWHAIATGDAWLTLAPNGNTLKIIATSNTTTTRRKAILLIMAGAVQQTVEIEQTAADIIIEIKAEDVLAFDIWGGNRDIRIHSNAPEWNVKSEETWITVVAEPRDNHLTLRVAPNEKPENRTGKITVTSGNKMQEITVSQHLFLLPLLEMGATGAQDIKAFEAARQSQLVREPDGFQNTNHWYFKTKNQFFEDLVYNVGRERYMSAVVYLSKKNETLLKDKRQEFDIFIKKQGFEQDPENGDTFFNKERGIRVTIFVEKTSLAQPRVTLAYIPKQETGYHTFDKIPHGLTTFGTATEADIQKYEKENGGVYNENTSLETNSFYFDTLGKAPLLARVYFMTLTEPFVLEQTGQLFDNINLAVWQYADRYYPTAEFLALTQKEGFEFIGYNPGNQTNRFYSAVKKLVLFAGPIMPDPQNGKVLLEIALKKEESHVTAERTEKNAP